MANCQRQNAENRVLKSQATGFKENICGFLIGRINGVPNINLLSGPINQNTIHFALERWNSIELSFMYKNVIAL